MCGSRILCSFGFAELAEDGSDLESEPNDLLGSFACPKETNQRKGQPQIFFGIIRLTAIRVRIFICMKI